MSDYRGKNYVSRSYLEKRKQQRRHAECPDIWEKEPNYFKDTDEVYKSFFKVAEKQRRKDSSSDSDDSSLSNSESIQPPSEKASDYLNRKRAKALEQIKSEKPKIPEPAEPEIIAEEIPEEEEVDADLFGPQPIKVELDKKDERKFYAGIDLSQAEKEAYSKCVQEGKRIPRRGEVGLTSDEIERYESLGYVMSGSRNKKMNAARIKKEAQVYTAEEKKALAIYNLEEQQRRERNIINEMKVIWQTSQKEEDSKHFK